jgi:hypothetical protein
MEREPAVYRLQKGDTYFFAKKYVSPILEKYVSPILVSAFFSGWERGVGRGR